ncbi:MAG: nucleotidyl transferase AbiEii/AbiGii toxin family protein [Spirochaetales bacterium]|nr:nucleotidyl transferase AbiEii/AbiGii toxin family protein [Spirochaetales bacterium]
MNSDGDRILKLHNDPDLFKDALATTEAVSGFNARLIEKDYYCSVVLLFLYRTRTHQPSLIFKGGTCLSKVYGEFYRLSEDLDFVIPMKITSTRSERRRKIKPLKTFFNEISISEPAITIVQELTGHNNSTQYIACIEYASVITGTSEQIKIEIGLREPLLLPENSLSANTLIISGFTGERVVLPFLLTVMDFQEAYAEKCRAALTRRVPAIRDFFDIIQGIEMLNLDLFTPQFVSLVKNKLTIPGNSDIDVSAGRKELLRRQVVTELKPVIRKSDFERFNLDKAFTIVERFAESIQS